jgi:hypothetical protein
MPRGGWSRSAGLRSAHPGGLNKGTHGPGSIAWIPRSLECGFGDMKPRILVSEKACEMLEGNPSAPRRHGGHGEDRKDGGKVETRRLDGGTGLFRCGGFSDCEMPGYAQRLRRGERIADRKRARRRPRILGSKTRIHGFVLRWRRMSAGTARLRFVVAHFHAFLRSYMDVCVRPFHWITP